MNEQDPRDLRKPDPVEESNASFDASIGKATWINLIIFLIIAAIIAGVAFYAFNGAK